MHPFGKLVLSQPFNSLYPAIPLASYFCAVHSLGELSSCRPFNFSSFGELFLCRPFNSPFFDKLVSCRPFNSPSVRPFGELFCAIHPLGELFACRLFNAPFARPFGELILYRLSLGQVIFVPSIPWAHYFRAGYSTLHPSINLASIFINCLNLLLTLVWRLIFCYEFTSGSFGHL